MPLISSPALEEAPRLWSDGVRKLLSKFTVLQKDESFSVGNTPANKKTEGCLAVISGLCYDLTEIWGSKVRSSGEFSDNLVVLLQREPREKEEAWV